MKLVSLISVLVLSLIFIVGCGRDDPESFEIPDANLRAGIIAMVEPYEQPAEFCLRKPIYSHNRGKWNNRFL